MKKVKATPNVLGIEIPGLQDGPAIEIYAPPCGPGSEIRMIIGSGMIRIPTQKFLKGWEESLKRMEPRNLVEIRAVEGKNLLVYIYGDRPGSTKISKKDADRMFKLLGTIKPRTR